MKKQLGFAALWFLTGCPVEEGPGVVLHDCVRSDVRIYRMDSQGAAAQTTGLPVILPEDEDALNFPYDGPTRPSDDIVRAGIRSQVTARVQAICGSSSPSLERLRASLCDETSTPGRFAPAPACVEVGEIKTSRPWVLGTPARVTDPAQIFPPCPRLAHAEPATLDFGAVPVSDPMSETRRWSSNVTVTIVNDSADTMTLDDQAMWADDLNVTNYMRDVDDPGSCFECTDGHCTSRMIPGRGRCTVKLRAAASYTPSRRLTVEGVAEGSLPFLITLTSDPNGERRTPTINVGVRQSPRYSEELVSTCMTVESRGTRCAAQRILLTARDGRDQYLGLVSLSDPTGAHNWEVRAGTEYDSPNLGLAAYARQDRPIAIFITRCDGEAFDTSAILGAQRNSTPVVTDLRLLNCHL